MALQQTSEAPMRVWVNEDRSIRLDITPGGIFGAGVLDLTDTGDRRIVMHELKVDEQYRQNGIGTRLMRGLGYTAASLRPDRFSGFITSPYSLRIMRTVFGEEAISYEKIDFANNRTYDHLTTEQATAELLALQEFDEEDGITAVIDLGRISLDSLERPEGLDEILATYPPTK